MAEDTFDFTDEEFLAVVNQICQKESTYKNTYVPIKAMDESLIIDRLDSLGIIIFFVWLTELFGIPEEPIDAFVDAENFTIAALKKLVMEHCTHTYSYADTLEFSKRCL